MMISSIICGWSILELEKTEWEVEEPVLLNTHEIQYQLTIF